MSARTPKHKKLRTWIAYAIRGAKAAQLGHVEASDEEAAAAAAVEAYGVPASRILVQATSRG